MRRFVDARCEETFAELVRRHGPAVYGVCRRALGDHHLAEDAFQAVFVVLARKADGVSPPGAVGGWLYVVARTAAAEAAAMCRRKRREHLPGTLPDQPADAPEPDDTAAAVDAAIAELPAPLRSAVLLCEIEGVPRARAAAQLGIAEGTLSSRLAKARKVLADRLRRRGLAGLATAGAVAVPPALAGAAAGRADRCAAGDVLELANGVLRTMLATKLRLTPVWALCAAVAAGGALAVAPASPAATRSNTPACPAAARANAPVPVRPPEWTLLFTLEHTSPVSAVAAGRELIATFEVDGVRPRSRLWKTADGRESELEVRGAWFPNAPARVLRFTTDDAYLVMTNADDESGCATRYRRRPEALVGDTMGGFDTAALSTDLTTIVNRDRPRPGQPARKDRLFLHGDPWADPKNILNPADVFDYPGGHAVTHAELSADGRRLAVAGDDSVVRVYDRASLRELHAIALKPGVKLTAIRLSDDGGRLAVVGEAGFAKVFDAAGAELCELRGHTGPVAAVAFTADGKRVAAAAGRVVRVYDAKSGKPDREIAGHAGDVRAVAFSPGGERLVTGSADKTAKVWKLKD